MRKPYGKYLLRTLIGGSALMILWWIWPLIFYPQMGLSIKVEGLLEGHLNFRDAGSSFNQCRGQELLPVGRVLRSSEFFSSLSCSSVGNPDVIYSLNYESQGGTQYFCRNGLNILVGDHFQEQELNDIEFSKNWVLNSPQTTAVCKFLNAAAQDFREQKKILFHCEAGRDRTGAITAIFNGMILESKFGTLSRDDVEALECDYQKSRSLKSYKYGRIKSFLNEMISERGSVTNYVSDFCGPIVL